MYAHANLLRFDVEIQQRQAESEELAVVIKREQANVLFSLLLARLPVGHPLVADHLEALCTHFASVEWS